MERSDTMERELGRQVGNKNQLLPPGYSLWIVDDHYLVVRECDDAEFGIDWNRWRLYRQAWCDYRKRLV
jgi:hypothetical protein